MNYESYNSILQFIPEEVDNSNLYIEKISQSILHFIQENNITKVLVSLSGGVDSMVMTCILKSLNIDFVCCHINYNNREESKYEQILLEVRVSNSVAINMYESFGFKHYGIREKYYKNEDANLFRLEKTYV